MPFEPQALATAIGSMPHLEPELACSLIMATVPVIPVWPQLPKTDFREQMEIQYSEGFPRVVLDEAKQKMYVDTSGDPTPDLEQFYENVLTDNLEYFRISPTFSRGIYEMERLLSQSDLSSINYFKSQVTGPITFGLATVDEAKRALYYNEVFRDVVIKGITMKARWLVKKFDQFGLKQLCFVDEPILSAFGSSTYVSVQRADVVAGLKEVVDAVHQEGVLVGTHCCGNTEWTILIDAGVDIISFDAYEYGDTIGYYPDQVRTFLEQGGVLAWGIVPTSDKLNQETPETIVAKFEKAIDRLVQKGINKELLRKNCLLTPSCGTGSLTVDRAEKIQRVLAEVSTIIRTC